MQARNKAAATEATNRFLRWASSASPDSKAELSVAYDAATQSAIDLFEQRAAGDDSLRAPYRADMRCARALHLQAVHGACNRGGRPSCFTILLVAASRAPCQCASLLRGKSWPAPCLRPLQPQGQLDMHMHVGDSRRLSHGHTRPHTCGLACTCVGKAVQARLLGQPVLNT